MVFLNGSTRYRFFLSIVFHKCLMFPQSGEENLGFGWLKLLASVSGRSCVYFLCFLPKLKLLCFCGNSMELRIWQRCRLNETFSVSAWFGFLLRSESPLSICWTLSSKKLWRFVSGCWFIMLKILFLFDGGYCRLFRRWTVLEGCFPKISS